jgi:hypothetical protein
MMSAQNQPRRTEARGLLWMLAMLFVLVGVALAFYWMTPTDETLTVQSAAASPSPTAGADARARAQPGAPTVAVSPAVSPPPANAETPAATSAVTANVEPPETAADGDATEPEQAAKKAKKTVSKVEAEFFTIEVVGCKASGTAIGCDLRITNNGDDRNLAIDSGRLYDNFGNRYELSARRVANVSGWNWIKLFRGTPVKAWVEFNKDSQQAAESVTALELKFAAEPRGFEIQFRNLPLAASAPAK